VTLNSTPIFVNGSVERVGNHNWVGAMAVVLTDVPDGAIAVAQPACVLRYIPVSIGCE